MILKKALTHEFEKGFIILTSGSSKVFRFAASRCHGTISGVAFRIRLFRRNGRPREGHRLGFHLINHFFWITDALDKAPKAQAFAAYSKVCGVKAGDCTSGALFICSLYSIADHRLGGKELPMAKNYVMSAVMEKWDFSSLTKSQNKQSFCHWFDGRSILMFAESTIVQKL
jgi:hypothetical protein